jgi:hypothetical protein
MESKFVRDTNWYNLVVRHADRLPLSGDFDSANLPPPPRSLRDLSTLKQYGLAIAAIPDKDNPTLMTVNCNGICVFGGQRDDFELVPELSFRQAVNLNQPASLESAYIKVVNTLDTSFKYSPAKP